MLVKRLSTSKLLMKASHDTVSVEMKVFILIAYVESKFASKGRKFMFHLSYKNNRSRTFCGHSPRTLVFFTEYTEWHIRTFLTCKLKTNFETFITSKRQNLQISC